MSFIYVCVLYTCFLLIPESSAYQNRLTNNRIIDGTTANSGEYPFVAAIYVTTSDSKFFCGGTLLNQDWIITAGQCVYNATLFTIYLGSNSLTSADPNRATLATSEYVLHPEYNPSTLVNDLGLIRLRLPVTYTEYIKPIFALPGMHVLDGMVVFVAGWGLTSDQNAELSDDLIWARLMTMTQQECQIYYGSQITDNMGCAVGAYYNEGSCLGDTGGPLIELIKGGPDAKMLIGVASFISSNGCESTDPSGYTRIFPYADWIRNITGF